MLDSFLSLLSPLLLGICIAYVVNLLLKVVERLWDKALAKAPELWRIKLKRPICLVLTMLLFLGIIFSIIFILIPRLEEAGRTLVANVPVYSSKEIPPFLIDAAPGRRIPRQRILLSGRAGEKNGIR